MRILTLLTLSFLLSSTSYYRRTIDDAYLNLLTTRLEGAGSNIDSIINDCEQAMIDGHYFSGGAPANYMYFIKHANQTGEVSVPDFHIDQRNQEALSNLDITVNFDSLGEVWNVKDTNNFSYKMSSIFDEIEAKKDISPTIVTTSILNHVNSKDFDSPLYKLLFFKFLVGTINTEKGLQVLLPPYPDTPTQDVQLDPKLVLEVVVDGNDQVMVSGVSAEVMEIAPLTKTFLTGDGAPTSQKIVSLKNQRGTSIKKYVAVYNEITRAYNEVRDEVSKTKFNSSFEDLESTQQKEVRKLVPMRISEAEPVAD